MVAYLTFTKNVSRSLHYNEKKVEQKSAEFIHAENFIIDKSRLTLEDKQDLLKRLSDLNTQVRRNTLHAKLLLHPDDHLFDSTLAKIADRYMEQIGFKDQPYLVYRHDDAGEQHVHIVSSLITESGKRIDTERQPWSMSVDAAQSIEKEYGLREVVKKWQKENPDLNPAFVSRIEYGKKNILQSVGDVLNMVTKEYKFTSMEELNALLRPYNIYADSCKPGSHTWQHQGLYYRVLDEQGKNRCAPIKSSDLYCRPTKQKLEQHFQENQAQVKEAVSFIKSRIDWILLQEPENLKDFDQALRDEGIHLVIGKGETKHPDLFYVDHQSRTVVNGLSIGKEYGAEELFRQFPDSLQKYHTAVPQLLSHLTEHLPEPDELQQQYKQNLYFKKHS